MGRLHGETLSPQHSVLISFADDAAGDVGFLARSNGAILAPEDLIDAFERLPGVLLAVTRQMSRAAVVDGVGGARQVIDAAGSGVFVAGDGIVLQIVHEDLAAGAAVVADIPAQAAQVVKAAP